ncbi:hypothetical protein AX16_004446 [Volvariella volvacea WC 439]|nr:hypothetical protein AX16_004446 [Volvariella volvacea WC 439]
MVAFLRQLSKSSSTISRSVVASRGFSRVASLNRTGILSALPKARVGGVSGAQQWRAFSVSTARFGAGTTDVSLAQRLQAEIQYEKEAAAELDAVPEFLQAFKDQGHWQVEDVPGNDEITLTRKFGNENLRLMFSIADLQAEEDAGEYENPDSEEGAEESVSSSPIRASLSITKTNGSGALNVDMVCQEGHFIVDNICYYPDAKLGTELTADADWKRRGLYIGPQFDTLDVAVQEEFEKYLQERGVNESVALFIPEYAEWKEQNEYVGWLNNVKSFVEL